MALRFLLVALVASLGFELPSGRDLATWTRSGRDWVDARLADLSAPRDRAEPAAASPEVGEQRVESSPSTPIEAASTRADLAFEAVVEAMTADFSADLASIDRSRPLAESVATGEPPPAPAVDAGSRAEKLTAAVRLTREAVNAWASLIQPSTAEVAPEDPGDAL